MKEFLSLRIILAMSFSFFIYLLILLSSSWAKYYFLAFFVRDHSCSNACTRECERTHPCVHMLVETRGGHQISSSIITAFVVWDRNLFEPGAYLFYKEGWTVRSKHLSLPTYWWRHRKVQLCPSFTWVLGIQTQLILLLWRTLHWLNDSPVLYVSFSQIVKS